MKPRGRPFCSPAARFFYYSAAAPVQMDRGGSTGVGASGKLHVTVADPADFFEDDIKQKGKDRGQDDRDKDKAEPVKGGRCNGRGSVGYRRLRRLEPAGYHADRTTHAAGSHTGIDRYSVHLELEQAGRDGAGYRRGKGRRDPYLGVFQNIAHLKHGGPDALGHDAAPAVILKRDRREAHHLGAAAGYRGSAGKTGKPKHRAYRGGGDRKRERDADDNRHDDAHKEGLKICRFHNEQTKGVRRRPDRRGDKLCKGNADKNGNARGNEQVDLGLL